MRFADIIGQQALRARLAECIDRGRVSHAQLFAGPQILDKGLLVADLALGDQQAGHLAEDLLLAAGL